MYSKMPPYKVKKRPHDESEIERPRKIPYERVKMEDDALDEMVFQFCVLLPNSTAVELKVSELRSEIPIKEFMDVVKKEYFIVVKRRRPSESKRRINWDYNDLHFTDVHSKRIQFRINLRDFMPNKSHFLWLHDGSPEPDVYEGMWDLTPDTDLLKELPDDYTFETALSDLIDNSLQALWSNDKGQRRLISVDYRPGRISIFDSGPGMDGADGNLVKWGKMGASLHRSMRGKAIGGEPPYLMPFFGMFGYGGPVATMCLGKRAVVSSKTKNCSKVFTLHLEREALVSASRLENCWRTKGGMRDPYNDEKENSPHKSFTKIEIFEPKVKTMDVKQLRRKLKDIYFPYIQCDEVSGKTSTPIEFQVNGIDLAEIQGGEVATTNLHSCHGPDFILQLHFRITQDSSSIAAQNQRVLSEANARLKCVYFPKVKGEESIKSVLDELEKNGCGIRESFENFSRVSVRRLGRLLPDTRWALLPFMEPKPKKGEKGHTLRRLCSRVKCFIDTDSGFNPTPHKTDLAYHHPYTKALKNFGNRAPENEEEVQVETFRDGKKLTLAELEKQYNDWISEMHVRYDEEIDAGLDQPIIVFSSKNKKLGISSEVLTVHKQIQRKGKRWTADQNIKILKGACPGCHGNNVYATLEYIILEGLPGDACSEAWLICRLLGIPKDRGCHLLVGKDNNTIDFRESRAFPIRVIDSEKCIPVEGIEWGKKLEAYDQKLPSSIDLLSDIHCRELEINGGLPATVQAGDAPPENIVAVIRPKSFGVGNSSNKLEQKCIFSGDKSGEKFKMTIEIKCRCGDKSREFDHVYSASLSPSSHKETGLHGLYVLELREKCPSLFQKAGFYKFSFSLAKSRDLHLERVVQVQASAEVGRWKVVNKKKGELYTASVGSCFKPLSVACYDRNNNRTPFPSVPKLNIELHSNGKVLARVRSKKVDITPDNLTMRIKEIFVKRIELDDIRPNYEATLNISGVDEAVSVDFPCRVIPGTPEKIAVLPPKIRKELVPGQIIEELSLEVFDEYGNHVKEDEIISLRVDGFSVQDIRGVVRAVGTDFITEVDSEGFVDLSGMLKVSKGYGKDVLLSVISKEKVIFQMQFRTVTRELRSVQKVFRNCEAGSILENVVFEITDSRGKVDESIHDEEKHGQSHSLTIKSDSFDISDCGQYSFHHGRCTIPSIPLPQREGTFFFTAVHSCYPELNLVVEVHVENALREGHDNTYTINDEECVTPIYSSPDLKTPKRENSGHKLKNSMKLWSPAKASQDLGNLTGSPSISLKKLEDDLVKSAMAKNDHSTEIERLSFSRLQIQQSISDLQASLDRDVGDVPSTCDEVSTLKQIESNSGSAAAVICKVLAEVPIESRPQDVVGVVALLGTVPTIELSRMLAQYLGEDQLLATVCKDYNAAYYLETNILHKFATKFGLTFKGGYHAFCIEDIRPKFREPSSDPQQLLNLESPTLPNGNVPLGFLNYAVNLISIEENYLQWRIKSGHGLRETLFYRLFGELQVYRNRDSMMAASSCIKDGALSLDGAIMRGNGLVSLGHWEPKILFPVTLSPESLRISQILNEKKSDLYQINELLCKEQNSFSQANRKYLETQYKYNLYSSQIKSSSAPQI